MSNCSHNLRHRAPELGSPLSAHWPPELDGSPSPFHLPRASHPCPTLTPLRVPRRSAELSTGQVLRTEVHIPTCQKKATKALQARPRRQSQGYTGRRVLYCGENRPKGDEKRNTPSHVPDPKQGSEMKPVLMRAREKLTGFLVVALGTEQIGPGVGFCSFSTRN